MLNARAACALCAALLLFSARDSRANQYEIFIDIETEEDLYDLRVADQISDATFQTLVELYQRGVNLDTATRSELYALPNLTYAEVDAILAYRAEVGRIDNPASLVVNGVLPQRKLEAIAAFLVLEDAEPGLLQASGWARLQSRYSAEDDGAAPLALQARAESLRNVRAGVAVLLARQRLGAVRFDPLRQALTAEAPEPSTHVPKAYVSWENQQLAFVAGTYRIGFGQSLTFDNTDLVDPNGFYGDEEIFRDASLTRACKEAAGELATSPCAGAAGDVYVTPDFRWRDSLLGVAASLKELDLGDGGTIAAHAFTSYQPRSIYQYEIYSPETCDDPRNDGEPGCKAPLIYRTQDDPLEQTSRFSYHVLPNMFAEALAGGNLSYSPRRRTRIGVTGYGAHVDWLVEGMELDFQEWSSTPFGGDYGAVGVDAQHGIGNTDLFAELARSFDSMPGGGGGFGALARSVTSWGDNELEGSLRYYEDDFANPHARAIAAPDELDGLRARDELGARVRYSGTIRERLELRTNVDLHRSPSDEITGLLTYLRGDVDLSQQLRTGLWLQYQDKNLGSGGAHCFEVSDELDEFGEPIPCAGKKLQVIGRARFSPAKDYTLDLQYQHELLDDMRYPDEMRQDVSVLGIATAKLIERLRLRARSRYLFEDISDNQYLEQSWWTYVDLSYRLRRRDRLRLRYDLVVHLDDRTRTQTRTPSPEQWVWLEYESHF